MREISGSEKVFTVERFFIACRENLMTLFLYVNAEFAMKLFGCLITLGFGAFVQSYTCGASSDPTPVRLADAGCVAADCYSVTS